MDRIFSKGRFVFKTQKTTLLPAKKKSETILIDKDTAIQLLLERKISGLICILIKLILYILVANADFEMN